MTDITNLQPPISGANKKRKRASDAGRDGGSPKGPPMNGDHLDQTSAYGAEFVQHLQNATHGVSDSVGNGLGSDNPALPYGTNGEGHTGSFDMSDTNHQGTPYNYQAMYKHPEADVTPRSKPAVGSDEWHRNRKDCHKEVERRRRETINEGIMSLANIVPDCEKAKGAILQRAVSYVMELRTHIDQLQSEGAQTKGTLEGLLQQMTAANADLRADNNNALAEIERLKMKLQNAGINSDEE
ncbi:MAG: hypothetical protein GOMPHAMPRED_003882 [Gomphillus americanus]|uniref:BHLH domain-containing protein n=1 Tax=Gomphillus americanus TaxID=1940652 RepID=A0A8H3FIZ2_9LECA|nr:MAG: hypothetical protein GOMPHAMPRED_003882 [Gomphillus americanus]